MIYVVIQYINQKSPPKDFWQTGEGREARAELWVEVLASVEIFEFLEPERNRKVDDIVKVLTEQEQALLDKMLVNPVILGTTPPSDVADCQVSSSICCSVV